MTLKQTIAVLSFLALSLLGYSQTNYEIRKYSIADGLPSNLMACAEQDDRGLMWFGTWRGLCCFDGYEFISFNNVGDAEERPMCSRIASIKIDKDQNVWCITYDRRAYMLNTKDCSWMDVSKALEKKFGAQFRVRNVYPLKSGVIWISCYDTDNFMFRIGDIYDLNSATNEFGRLENERNKKEIELCNSKEHKKVDLSVIPMMASARKYLVDSQDNIWSLDNDLTRITPRKPQFYIKNDNSGKATRTIPVLPDMQGKPVYAALTDSKGRQWIGTKGGGLYLVQNGKTTHFTHSDEDAFSLRGNDVYDIFEDSRGHIWIACYDGGFNLYADNADNANGGCFINTNNYFKGFPKDKFAKVRHITEAKDGVMFLSTADGIVCFSNKFDKPEQIKFHAYSQSRDNQCSLPGGNVMQTLQASDGRFYISTMTGGLTTIKSGDALKDNLVFETIKETQDTEGIVLTFIEDQDGYLWLARENYLEKYNPRTHESMFFSDKDFGREISFSEALPIFDAATGCITFGVRGGTMSFNPKEVVKSSYVPRIFFSYVQFQGSQVRQPIIYADELDVPSDKRDLTIYFSAIDYQNNIIVEYAYKIDGVDNDWNYVGRNHCVSFNNLPCGHLKLLVKSTNADGVWVENTAELAIYSHPTFWETPWAWLLYLIIIAGIVYVAVYIVLLRQRHRREREEMERKLEQLLASLNTQATENSAKNYSLPEVQIEDEEKRMMERLMVYIDKNISNVNLRIVDLADAVNMSRSVLYERVKNVTGMPPGDFLRYMRIQRAKQILATTDMPIAQIAYEIGFSEPTYFGKVFKKATGHSPLSYRKNNSSEHYAENTDNRG